MRRSLFTHRNNSNLEHFADGLRKRLTAPLFLALLVTALLTLIFWGNRIADPDLFARLAVGKLAMTTGLAFHDPFSFLPTKPIWIDHEWLSGVIFYSLYDYGGDWLLYLFKIAIVFYTVLWVVRSSMLVTANSGSWIWLVFTIIPCAYLWQSTVRSQVFTYCFLGFLFYALLSYQYHNRQRYLALVPPIFLLWSNLHGGFVVGLGFLGIATVLRLLKGSRSLFLPCIFVLSFGATFISPYGGLNYWRFILEAITMPRPDITEWAPISVWSKEAVWPGVVAMILVAGIIHKRAGDLFGAIILIVSLVAGIKSVRFMGLFFIAAAIWGGPLVANLAQVLGPRYRPKILTLQRAAALAGFLGLLAAGFLFVLTFVRKPFMLDRSNYPEAALNWLAETQSGGNVLVDFTAGSYALWVLPQEFKIAVDGRYEEVYSEETVQLAMRALSPQLPGHEAAVAAVAPDYIVAAVNDTDTAALVAWQKIGWGELFRGGKFLVLGKLS